MKKPPPKINELQQLTNRALLEWLSVNNVTEAAFAKLIGQTQRNVARMTARDGTVPPHVAIVINLFELLPFSKRKRILADLRAVTPQLRKARERVSR